jgi:uncharacterized protein
MLFYRTPDRRLLVLAVLLLVGVPRVAQRIVQGPATPAELRSLQIRMDTAAEEHWRAVAGGDVPAIVRFHAGAGFRAKWEFQFGPMGRGYQTFGLFLLGLWAGRRRLFEDVPSHRALFVRMWRWSGVITLVVPVVAGALFVVGQATSGGASQPPPGTLPDFTSWPIVAGFCVFDAWNNAMTLFYVASFALLLLRPRWQPRLLRFSPVGRMALSAYVGQTVIGVLVFFGFGLGLLGRVGNSLTIPMGLAVFAFQAWACRAWLERFRFGPLEWGWRSLTWLRREPFRVRPAMPA